jgi:hypothetical protein
MLGGYATHVVCDWLGYSETIARKHYPRNTDEHYRRDSKLQNQLQQPNASRCEELHQKTESPDFAGLCSSTQNCATARVGDEGLANSAVLAGKTAICKAGAAKSDALPSADDSFSDPDLARLAAAWIALDDATRKQIMAIAGL